MSAVPTVPGSLPDIPTGRLPAVYEAAQKAIAACDLIDECKSWADKAAALASYARQAKDDTMRLMALRIQQRATRRVGELLRQIEPARGANQNIQDGAVPKVTRESAAEGVGLSERQRKTALRLANVPQPEFEAAMQSATPPTVTELAERGKQTAPSTPRPLRVHTERVLLDLLSTLEHSLFSDITPLIRLDEITASQAADYAAVIDQALPALAALRDRLETRASQSALPN